MGYRIEPRPLLCVALQLLLSKGPPPNHYQGCRGNGVVARDTGPVHLSICLRGLETTRHLP